MRRVLPPPPPPEKKKHRPKSIGKYFKHDGRKLFRLTFLIYLFVKVHIERSTAPIHSS